MNGILVDKLDLNDFNTVTIRENNNNFGLEIDKLALTLNKVSLNDEEILEIVQNYLNSYRINGITNLDGFLSKEAGFDVIYGNEGNKLLRLQLFNSRFRVISKMILNKYLQDRYNFCWNEDIDLVKLDFGKNISRFDRCALECEKLNDEIICFEDFDVYETYVKFVLQTDEDGNIYEFERNFIKDFIYDRFWKIGDMAVCNCVFEDKNGEFKGYEVLCGKLKMFIPFDLDRPFISKYILDIVNSYNQELYKIKENVEKRQLKMEGF